MGDLSDLQARWKHLYQQHLPALARQKDPVQKEWPVYFDHCFARIVLDNAVGIDRSWTEVLKSPAYKHMTSEQLQAAIDLGERLATGKANLVELDNRSLDLRGKKRKAESDAPKKSPSKKQKQETGTISGYFLPSPTSPQREDQTDKDGKESVTEDTNQQSILDIDMSVQIKRIADSNLTPFRKQALTMLCQIPRGRYSTYQCMSDYISKTSHKTCARAVGNAMRNNPFAPEVPCHRIVAHDGSLGGFGGHWGENGKFASKKHELLHEEGVRFDSKGKVKGPPFREFGG